MQERISNCKSMGQRRKDKTDPIVNPAYFIKHAQDMGQVTIDAYSKKVQANQAASRPQSAVNSKHKAGQGKTGGSQGMQGMEYGMQQTSQEVQQGQRHYQSKLPSYAKTRPQSATMGGHLGVSGEGVPGCSFR